MSIDLRNAAINGELEKVQQLVADGADVNSKYRTGAAVSSLLHVAASRGRREVIEFLIDKGANIEAVDSDGQTPIVFAVKHRHNLLIKLFIEKGADIDVVDNKENNLLHIAASVDHPSMVPVIALLREKGVDAEAENEDENLPKDMCKHKEVVAALQ
mmetsp:Transcript_25294/g.28129  ORF Transcript_25294/g.28129 Transcript_25294/m.28129 type:complete len:157 (+) Transcript_25294:21-491(+)